MRVCIVTPEYSSARPLGGIGTHLSALASALARLGHEIHVIVPAAAGTMAGDVTVHAVRRPELGRLFPAADPIVAARAARKLRTLGAFDVILAPEYGGFASTYSRDKRAGPLLTNLQTSLEQALALTPPSTRWRGLVLQQALQRRAERQQAARSDAVLACSHALLEWSRQLWPLDGLPCAVLPNVIEIERVRRLGTMRQSPELPEGGPVITFTGRLEPRKGADTLVRAMTRVWDEEPGARLALAGRDGPWGQQAASEHLKALAGLGAPRVSFLGALQPEALMPLLARSDVAAFPSRWEAFGLAALEALALGVPTVATAVGGFTDFMSDGETALLVPPDDPGALASALLGLLRDPKRRRALGAAGARRAEAFDADVQAGAYERYLEGVARR